MKYLYRYETKGIQNWILSSNKLRDLAGGSALVEQLTKQAEKQARDLGAEVLQSTSGSMTAIFGTQQALQDFVGEWPMQVAYLVPGLQLVQAWVPEEATMGRLFERLQARRNAVPINDLDPNPWVMRSGKSGFPAVPTPGDIRSRSRATAMDLIAVAKERGWKAMGRASGDVTGGRPWDTFNEDLESWADGPVAVIHADGSGVGQRLIGLTREKVKPFSTALLAATRFATEKALETLPVHNTKDGDIIDARPVVSAGDDLTYIVPAAYARRFVARWLTAFNEETGRQSSALGGALYGGAGIVIVPKKYPFSRAYEMAERLCKKAKDQLKSRGWERNILAFERVTTSLVTDDFSGALGWILEGNDCAALDSLAEAVRGLPRGTMRTWLSHFERDVDGHADQLWARAKEVAEARAWSALEDSLRAIDADPSSGLLRKSSQVALSLGCERATPIRDALATGYFEKVKELV